MRSSQIPGTRESDGVCSIDPLRYPGWDLLLLESPQSSFFHGTAWARVLHDTYGHRPFYFCRFLEGRLVDLLPVMEVKSFLTGRRGVSLPFTDFCSPQKICEPGNQEIYHAALARGAENHWRYLECRSNNPDWSGATASTSFYGHVLELKGGSGFLFKSLNDSVRRGIKKAEKSGLKIEFANTFESIQTFYLLHSQTRQRHGLPPQPFRFFKNIFKHVLGGGQGFVGIARMDRRAIAAVVFFHDHRQAIYKFGASDYEYQHLRPNNLLMWESVKRCCDLGFGTLHFGRTSLMNEGLRRFKLGFGAREEKIECFKFDFRKQAFVSSVDRSETGINRLFRLLPSPLLRLAGEMLYPHLS